MIGVTIGIGGLFPQHASESMKAVEKYYDVKKTVMLTEKELNAFTPNRNRFPHFSKQVFFLKFCLPLILKDEERFLYFDADYRVVQKPPDDILHEIHTSDKLIAVRDRWEERVPYPWTYYNAGFQVHNRKNHEELYKWCRTNYFTVPEMWGEQCVWNRGIWELGIDVLELPHEYNACQEVWTKKLHRKDDPIAMHYSPWGLKRKVIEE